MKFKKTNKQTIKQTQNDSQMKSLHFEARSTICPLNLFSFI